MNVALIKDNKVENVAVVENLQWALDNYLEYDEIINVDSVTLGIGWIKQGGGWKDNKPIRYKKILTPLEFLNRFTNTEVKTIMRLSKQDEDVELWWLKYNKAQDMNLDDPQTIEGVQALETAGIIAVGRAAEILTKYPL